MPDIDNPLNTVLAALPRLAPSELRLVADLAADLLDRQAPGAGTAVEAAAAAGASPKGKRPPKNSRSHQVELKYIAGCGPYAYERWWEDGVHKSKYIGKAEDAS